MAFEPLFGKHIKILAVCKLHKTGNFKEILDKIKAGGQIPPLHCVLYNRNFSIALFSDQWLASTIWERKKRQQKNGHDR